MQTTTSEYKYMFVNNSIEKLSPLSDIPTVHTTHNFEELSPLHRRDENSSPYGTQIYLRNQSAPHTSSLSPLATTHITTAISNSTNAGLDLVSGSDDEVLTIKYFMLCLELERLGRVCEHLKASQQSNNERYFKEVQIELESLRSKETQKSLQIITLTEQNTRLVRKIRELEVSLREKDNFLLQREEELRANKLESSMISYNQIRAESTRIKELELELAGQRLRNAELSKKRDESARVTEAYEIRISSIQERERVLDHRVRELEEQLANLRTAKIRADELSVHIVNTRNEVQSLQRRLGDQSLELGRMPEMERKIRNLQALNSELTNQKHSLTAELKSLSAQALNQGELKKHFESLEIKIETMTQNIVEKERELGKKNSECLQLNAERNELTRKIEHLTYEIKKLERVAGEECLNCKRHLTEIQTLSTKNKKLEAVLKQKEAEELSRLNVKGPSSRDLQSLQELMEAAQSIKGSNERINRLLEATDDYDRRVITKSTSSKVLYHLNRYA